MNMALVCWLGETPREANDAHCRAGLGVSSLVRASGRLSARRAAAEHENDRFIGERHLRQVSFSSLPFQVGHITNR